jgi:subtilisin family serine protease
MTERWSTVAWGLTLDSVPTIPPVPRLDDIDAEWAWGGSDGTGVRIAVIDSGVDESHPAIGAPVSGYVEVSEGPAGLVYDNQIHGDTSGHGTMCAGIIRSLAPRCELYSVKVLGSGMGGRGTVFAGGLRWAIDHGMQVCNLSLGTTKKDYVPLLHELADLAYFRGICLVTAANNLPIPSFPSMFASVISVACHGGKNPYLVIHNPKPPVEFGAPGIDLRVPWLNGEWITTTGNSCAAPHITGLIAKILGKHPGLAPFQVKTILRALAANVADESWRDRTAAAESDRREG